MFACVCVRVPYCYVVSVHLCVSKCTYVHEDMHASNLSYTGIAMHL